MGRCALPCRPHTQKINLLAVKKPFPCSGILIHIQNLLHTIQVHPYYPLEFISYSLRNSLISKISFRIWFQQFKSTPFPYFNWNYSMCIFIRKEVTLYSYMKLFDCISCSYNYYFDVTEPESSAFYLGIFLQSLLLLYWVVFCFLLWWHPVHASSICYATGVWLSFHFFILLIFDHFR